MRNPNFILIPSCLYVNTRAATRVVGLPHKSWPASYRWQIITSLIRLVEHLIISVVSRNDASHFLLMRRLFTSADMLFWLCNDSCSPGRVFWGHQMGNPSYRKRALVPHFGNIS